MVNRYHFSVYRKCRNVLHIGEFRSDVRESRQPGRICVFTVSIVEQGSKFLYRKTGYSTAGFQTGSMVRKCKLPFCRTWLVVLFLIQNSTNSRSNSSIVLSPIQ